MRILIGQQSMSEIGHVERGTVGGQILTKSPVDLLQMPCRQQREFPSRLDDGDQLTAGQWIESARKGCLGSLGSLGDAPEHSPIPCEQTHRLGCFGVIPATQTDGGFGDA